MPTAVNLLRSGNEYRRGIFDTGLKRAGYTLSDEYHVPRPGDLLLIWNRYGRYDSLAKKYEQAGAKVIVVENGYLGKNWHGQQWFAMSLGQHNGAGRWFVGDYDRWDSLGVEIKPWREDLNPDALPVMLAQRGIGSYSVRMDESWPGYISSLYGGRIRVREHPKAPGARPAVDLEVDLAHSSFAVTWASGAGLIALLWGFPVVHGLEQWIGAPAATYYKKSLTPHRGDRLAMFRRMIWAQWRDTEIEQGLPFKVLCESL